MLQLSEAMNAVREDSRYMLYREDHHRALTESTYERLRTLAILEVKQNERSHKRCVSYKSYSRPLLWLPCLWAKSTI